MATYRISETTKHRIIYLREEGVSVTDISNELGISVSIALDELYRIELNYSHLFSFFFFLLFRETPYTVG